MHYLLAPRTPTSSAVFSPHWGVWLLVPPTSPVMVPALDQLLGKDLRQDDSWAVAVPGHCHCPCPARLVRVLRGCALVRGSTAPPAAVEQPAPAAPWHTNHRRAVCRSVATACHQGAVDWVLSLKIFNVFTQVWVLRCCTLLQPHLGQWGNANLSQMGHRPTHQLKNTQATIRHSIPMHAVVLWLLQTSLASFHVSL